jgi:hypothetical protein
MAGYFTDVCLNMHKISPQNKMFSISAGRVSVFKYSVESILQAFDLALEYATVVPVSHVSSAVHNIFLLAVRQGPEPYVVLFHVYPMYTNPLTVSMFPSWMISFSSLPRKSLHCCYYASFKAVIGDFPRLGYCPRRPQFETT